MTHRVYLFLALIVCLCFGNSLFGDFVFDDSEALVQNADVNSGQLSLIFKHDFWGNNLTDKSSHKSYRPLTILAYRCIWNLSTLFGESSQLNPLYYHAANLALYYMLCCQLYQTLCSLLASPIVDFSKQESKQIAYLTTLMFTCHPIHCEPVASCVGLADILCGLCCIVSLRIYIHKVKLLFTISKWSFSKIVQLLLLSSISSFYIGIALFFKEQGITYLGIFILINCIFLVMNRNVNRNIFLVAIFEIIFYLLVLFCLIFLRLWIMNFSNPLFSRMDNPASHMSNLYFRYINFCYIYLLNAFITICPIWLCFDWSMGCIPLIESIFDFRFALLIVSMIILFLVIGRLLYTVDQKEKRYILIFTIFFLLPFLPSSNIFFSVGFVIAERNLFIPILGYLLIFVTSYHQCLRTLSRSKKLIFQFGFYFLLLIYCAHSFSRTKDWIHERDLFEKDVRVCPGNAKIYYNIAKVAADNGDLEKAIFNYKKSIFLEENYTKALNNYGNILKDLGQLDLAKSLLQKACSLDPNFATALMNLAIVETSLHNYRQSEIYFHKVIKLRPNHAISYFNFGNLYLEEKRFSEAQNAYFKAVELNGQFIRAWNNLILLHQNTNKLDFALQLANRAILLNPNIDSLHFLAANILGQLNDVKQSEKHFKRAIALNPTVAVYQFNLGVLYHRNKMLSRAKEHYAKALLLDPRHKGAKDQLERVESHK